MYIFTRLYLLILFKQWIVYPRIYLKIFQARFGKLLTFKGLLNNLVLHYMDRFSIHYRYI